MNDSLHCLAPVRSPAAKCSVNIPVLTDDDTTGAVAMTTGITGAWTIGTYVAGGKNHQRRKSIYCQAVRCKSSTVNPLASGMKVLNLTWIAPDWNIPLATCFYRHWNLRTCRRLFWGCVYVHVATKLLWWVFPLWVACHLACVVVTFVRPVKR